MAAACGADDHAGQHELRAEYRQEDGQEQVFTDAHAAGQGEIRAKNPGIINLFEEIVRYEERGVQKAEDS